MPSVPEVESTGLDALTRDPRRRPKKARDLGAFSLQEYEQLSVLLIFACDEYQHDSLSNLRCAVKDGKLIADTFAALGFSVCIELYNAEVTTSSVNQALRALMHRYPMHTADGVTVNRIGRLFVTFIGHGTVCGEESFFCPHNWDPERYGVCVRALPTELRCFGQGARDRPQAERPQD